MARACGGGALAAVVVDEFLVSVPDGTAPIGHNRGSSAQTARIGPYRG